MDRLGPAGRLLAIPHVVDGEFPDLLDRIDADIDGIVRGKITWAGDDDRRAERQIEGLSREAFERLASVAPGRLEAWVDRIHGVLVGAKRVLSLEPLAMSLLPPLSETAPSKAAALLKAVLKDRARRSLGDDRAHLLTPSGIAHAFAMAEDPDVDTVLKSLIEACPDDGVYAQIVAAAAAAGRMGRLERFVSDWIGEGWTASLATAYTVAVCAGWDFAALAGAETLGRKGIIRSIDDRLRPRMEARRKAEGALAELSRAVDPRQRLRLEAMAISNATPGAPLIGDPGCDASDPLDALLSLRLAEAGERMRQNAFAVTLFGLPAPPAWMPVLSARH